MPSFLKKLTHAYPDARVDAQPASTSPDMGSNAAAAAAMPEVESEEGSILDQVEGDPRKPGIGQRIAHGSLRAARSAAATPGYAVKSARRSVAKAFSGPTEEEKIDRALGKIQPSDWSQTSGPTEEDMAHPLMVKMAPKLLAEAQGWGRNVRDEGAETADARVAAPKGATDQLPTDAESYVGSMTSMSVDGETVYFPDQLEKSAREALGRVGADNISRYLGLGFSPDEILAVALYTTAASYVMNAILRGQVKNESLIRIFSPWIDKTAEALAKLPEGAKNAQTGSKIDDNLGDDDWVSFDEVYRVDKWDGAFPQAALGWKQGGTIREDAFLSTAIKPGIYALGRDDVLRTIRNASAAKSVRDLSELGAENEALLPPGSAMRIDAIRERASQTDVKDMKAAYGDVDTLTAQKFDVETTLVDGKGKPIQENATTSDGDPVLPAGPLEAKVASKKDPLAV